MVVSAVVVVVGGGVIVNVPGTVEQRPYRSQISMSNDVLPTAPGSGSTVTVKTCRPAVPASGRVPVSVKVIVASGDGRTRRTRMRPVVVSTVKVVDSVLPAPVVSDGADAVGAIGGTVEVVATVVLVVVVGAAVVDDVVVGTLAPEVAGAVVCAAVVVVVATVVVVVGKVVGAKVVGGKVVGGMVVGGMVVDRSDRRRVQVAALGVRAALLVLAAALVLDDR